jgi:hypothetical protein
MMIAAGTSEAWTGVAAGVVCSVTLVARRRLPPDRLDFLRRPMTDRREASVGAVGQTFGGRVARLDDGPKASRFGFQRLEEGVGAPFSSAKPGHQVSSHAGQPPSYR